MSLICCIPSRRKSYSRRERNIKLNPKQIKVNGYKAFYRELVLDTLVDIAVAESTTQRINSLNVVANIKKNDLSNEESDIDSLTCKQINNYDSDDKKECIICLEDYDNNDLTIVTVCNHKYHLDCITEWYANLTYNKFKENGDTSDNLELLCPICGLRALGV